MFPRFTILVEQPHFQKMTKLVLVLNLVNVLREGLGGIIINVGRSSRTID